MIWNTGMSLAALEIADRMQFQDHPSLEWLNMGELSRVTDRAIENYGSQEIWKIPSFVFAMMPTPILRISDPACNLDFLEIQNYHFVSNRLRQIMGDDPFIRYRDVDSSPSVPHIREVGYAAFDVLKYGNPFDPSRMRGAERDVRQADGSLRREWIFDYADSALKSSDVYFRDDFTPPAPIFRGTGSLWIFATDEFADRVMRAGVTDMAFQDITGPINPPRERARQVR